MRLDRGDPGLIAETLAGLAVGTSTRHLGPDSYVIQQQSVAITAAIKNHLPSISYDGPKGRGQRKVEYGSIM
jgi:hypothetical protein